MRISDLYQRREPTISFEFFPPKTPESEEVLFRDTVPELQKLHPAFISVTYGAGGSTAGTSIRIVHRLRQLGIEALSHLTCVGHTQAQIGETLEQIRAQGVENILALRGDPPKGQTEFRAVEGGFSYAVDLIRHIREQGNFCVGAACYPEGHVECESKHRDWEIAAEKVDAGAEFLITQLFYDTSDFYDMEHYLKAKHDVDVPIIPGVLPFLSSEQIKRFTSLCGSKIPGPLRKKLEQFAGDDESVRQLGIDYCTKMCDELLRHGVHGIHFYCLNRSASCSAIMKNLKLA